MKLFFNFLLIVFLVVSVVIAWAYFPSWMGYVLPAPLDDKLQGVLGTFGDSYGALNTLFSGLAFTGIIVSIFLQSRELKETRVEIKAQSKQFELQTKSLNKQVFENTFFQLIQLHNEIIQSISVSDSKNGKVKNYLGRAAFKPIYISKLGEGMFIYERELTADEYPTDTNNRYLMFHELYGSQLGHYFRNIYQIIKFVDQSDVDNKKFYTNLLRAQLSSYELGLLFFNCISDLGSESFKPLVEKYEFFEHLPEMDYISKDEYRMYDLKAYGKTNKVIIDICKNVQQPINVPESTRVS